MNSALPFGARSTADQVIAGVDLSGKHMLVTGCNSGLGLETMNALAANGARVIGLSRTLEEAAAACAIAGRWCIPVACDLSDWGSIHAAAKTIGALPMALDAVVANAAVFLPTLQTHAGIEAQFQVNYLGHFALINHVAHKVRDGGRIVIVADIDAGRVAPFIDFDNLDGHAGYDPAAFHAQSKIAAAVFAAELSRRMKSRAVTVNIANPGPTKGTGLRRHRRELGPLRALRTVFYKSPQRGAATQTLLAASPLVAGTTGESWQDCRQTLGHPVQGDRALALRLWSASEELLAAHAVAPDPAEAAVDESKPLQAAA